MTPDPSALQALAIRDLADAPLTYDEAHALRDSVAALDIWHAWLIQELAKDQVRGATPAQRARVKKITARLGYIREYRRELATKANAAEADTYARLAARYVTAYDLIDRYERFVRRLIDQVNQGQATLAYVPIPQVEAALARRGAYVPDPPHGVGLARHALRDMASFAADIEALVTDVFVPAMPALQQPAASIQLARLWARRYEVFDDPADA